MNDKHGEKIRVVATIQKGGDDNPLANVTTANKYSIVKSDKPASKLIKKSKESVMETWEDQYGNKISLTDDLKKLKVTTEEALRKSEDKEVIEKRVKRTNKIVAISREEAMYKMELKNKKMKFETKEMDDNKLLDILKASKVDELDVQYTQYSDDLSSQTNLFEMKKQRKEKKHTTTTPTKQIIEKSKIPLKEITGTQVKLTSTETSMSTVPDKCQQLQLPDVKQSEIEVNSISQKKVIGKERSTEVEKNEENVKEDEKKMSQNVDEDEVVSEYLTTPLDYYLRGQLANRPSEYDDTTHNPGDRLR
ncbi:unnamed protein product [Brugia pahangi]|uniref:Coiled-coil domain-containing protein n=1 Tax=Brugia pahangi TaxID=6280 RepID=A0A0N4T8Q2_BRUPA|nr:unnamed protein product [Brugia pahangi]